ncbi:MAG: hypothetical protein EON94_07795, partial [Caulobacteraceae bacterium]
MKLKLMAGAATLAFLAASGAHAQDTGWYSAVDLGWDNPKPWKATSSFQVTQGASTVDTNSLAGAQNTTALGSVTIPAQTKNLRYNFTSDEDWLGFARLGYRAAPNWRVELELGARRNDAVAIGGSPTATENPYSGASATTAGCVTCSPLVAGGGVLPAGAGTYTTTAGVPTIVGTGYGYDLTRLTNVRGGHRTLTAMINVIYDFAPQRAISPFLGIGIGGAYVDRDVVGNFNRSI